MFGRGGKPCDECHLWICKCDHQPVPRIVPDCETPDVESELKGRDALAEAICNHSHAATRRIPKVGSDKLKTPWDLDHERINELLTLWQLAE
jgi:hypothetical protein